jgi:precorrin-6A/cobalt-precorrin-6A reductase
MASSSLRILLLGGSSEASALAAMLAGDARFAATLSLAGRTIAPRTGPLPTRVGGFGGADGLADWLRAEAVAALVNATHPFAARMSANAAAAARATGVPLLRLRRPPWEPQPGDDWREVADMAEAADALGQAPRRVLLTIGRNELAVFAARAPQHRYVIRSVDPPPAEALPPHATVLTARGPFALEDEIALLREHGIEMVMTKNSGGTATEAKLAAARLLGLPVVMVARPPPEPGVATVPDAASAFAWLAQCHAGTAAVWRGV